MQNVSRSYLKNEMYIDVAALEFDIITNVIEEDRELIYSSIDDFFSIAIKFGSDRSSSIEESLAVKDVNHIFNQAPFQSDIVSYYCDAIRYAFTHFVDGRLLQLYEHQQNECWFPKLILKEVLKPNDIDTLPNTITIYRGCYISEHRAGKYKQAWTTRKEVAQQFAFVHYQNQDWFNKADRVVLVTTISKDALFYSKQSSEFEVVINTSELNIDEIYALDVD